MLKSFIISFLTIWISFQFPNYLFAQSAISLSSAQQLALQNKEELKISKYQTDIAKTEKEKINTNYLPTISSEVDFRYNSQLQSNVLPGIAFGPQGTPDRRITLGTPYQSWAGISLSQPLFKPEFSADKAIAKEQITWQVLQEKKTSTEIIESASLSYLQSLWENEKVKIANFNLNRTLTIYQTAQSQYAQGIITENQLNKYKLDQVQAKAEVDKCTRNLMLALSDLSWKTGTTIQQINQLIDSLPALLAQTPTELSQGFEIINRPELAMEKSTLAQQLLKTRKIKKSYLPTVSLYAQYTAQYLNQNANYFEKATWFPYNYIGIKANFTIWDGGIKQKNINTYQLQSEISRLKYNSLEKEYQQDLRTAITKHKNAKQEVDIQKSNRQLSEDIWKTTSLQLSSGIALPQETLTAYYSVLQQQQLYLNAIYDYLNAWVAYQKITGFAGK